MADLEGAKARAAGLLNCLKGHARRKSSANLAEQISDRRFRTSAAILGHALSRQSDGGESPGVVVQITEHGAEFWFEG